MAISRAQLAKELEPGLNALFGMEYGRYENEHSEIFEAALARDADRAVKALEEHLQRARKVIGDNRLLLG